MRASELNFPYPVLGMNDSILGEEAKVNVVSHIPLKERMAEPYRWDFEVIIKNKDILDLVNEGKAEYMCEVLCSATLLRKSFFSSTSTFTVTLGRKEVNKRVEFAIYVVSKERIPTYRNAEAHPDYREVDSFDIAKGAPLAILNTYHWDADLCYEDLTSMRSILRIVANDVNTREEYIVLDTEGDYITLMLPKAQYKAIMDVAGDPGLAGVIHSSLVLFALQGALAVFSKEKTHRWERALEAMVERNDAFHDLELGAPGDVSTIAERLLNNPFKRFCEVLPSLAQQGRAAQEALAEEDDGDEG